MVECDMDTIDDLSPNAIKRLKFQPVPEGEQWRISVIRDLVEIREGFNSDIGWSKEDLSFALELLTTS